MVTPYQFSRGNGIISSKWEFSILDSECTCTVRGDRPVSASLRAVPLPHPHQLSPSQTGRRLQAALQLRQALRSSSDPAGVTMFNVIGIG